MFAGGSPRFGVGARSLSTDDGCRWCPGGGVGGSAPVGGGVLGGVACAGLLAGICAGCATGRGDGDTFCARDSVAAGGLLTSATHVSRVR